MPEPAAFALLGEVWRLSFRLPESEGSGLVRYHFGGDTRYSCDAKPEFKNAKVVKLRHKPALLLWAPELKALYIFPGFNVPKSAFKPGIPDAHSKRSKEAAKVFNQYDHGAKASRDENTCAVPDYPEPLVRLVGSAYDVVYRSEKWNGKDGAREDYQHHFSKSGAVKYACDSTTNPKGVLIRGGRLTVNDRGIIY